MNPKFVKFLRVRAKNIFKSAFEKYSFTNVGDFAERPGPSCNLHYVCVVLWRGRAKRPRKEGKRRWWEIQPKRISIISGPNKQVIFESINSKIVINLCISQFHLRPGPPRATEGHLPALSVPGVGHLQILHCLGAGHSSTPGPYPRF